MGTSNRDVDVYVELLSGPNMRTEFDAERATRARPA